MSLITQPHDAFFKAFMNDVTVARDFLNVHLPPSIVARCDMSTLQIESGSFISQEMRQSYSDLLYSVKSEGKDLYIYMLIEHQSGADEHMLLRLLEYQVAAMRRHIDQGRGKLLPVVVPILFYHGTKSPYPYPLDIRECFDLPELAQQVFPGPIQLIDLTVTPDQELQTHGRAAAFEMVLKHIRTRDILLLFKDIRDALLAHPLTVDKVKTILQYLLEKGECSDNEAFHSLIFETAPHYGEEIMTLAQQFRYEGQQKGHEEGLQEGVERTAINMLRKGFSVIEISEITGFDKMRINALTASLTPTLH